jgi:hypothetical protein
VTDEADGFTFDVVETSAGAYLVTGWDRVGRNVTLRGADPESLRVECRRWLEEQNSESR